MSFEIPEDNTSADSLREAAPAAIPVAETPAEEPEIAGETADRIREERAARTAVIQSDGARELRIKEYAAKLGGGMLSR